MVLYIIDVAGIVPVSVVVTLAPYGNKCQIKVTFAQGGGGGVSMAAWLRQKSYHCT